MIHRVLALSLILTVAIMSQAPVAEAGGGEWGRFTPLVKDNKSLLDDMQTAKMQQVVGLKIRPWIGGSGAVPGDQTSSNFGFGLGILARYRHELLLGDAPPDFMSCPPPHEMSPVHCQDLMIQAMLKYDKGWMITLLLGLDARFGARLKSLPYEDRAGRTIPGTEPGDEERGVHAGTSMQASATARVGLAFIPWRNSMGTINYRRRSNNRRMSKITSVSTRPDSHAISRYAIEMLAGATYTRVPIQAVAEESGGTVTSDIVTREFIQPTFGGAVGMLGFTGMELDILKVFTNGGGWLVRGRLSLLNLGVFLDFKTLENLKTPDNPVFQEWGATRYNEITFGLDFQFNVL
jgi:hypothetical protein